MPDKNTQLTRADAYALAHIPQDRWFTPAEAGHAIKNRFSRLQRLVAMGRLEDRITGPIDNLKREFRRVR
jgi:hypothetical protein